MSDFRQQFLTDNELDSGYLETAKQWIEPLGDKLAAQFKQLRQQDPGRAMIVGISGCQGSGKSTMASYLRLYLGYQYALNCISCSIDDFYLSRADRLRLAEQIHPLLSTRGVPGTHDIGNLFHCLDSAKKREAFELPIFDKLRDDTAPDKQIVDAGVDLFILEGWCLGATAQDSGELASPLNTLERDEDPNGEFRYFVNQQIQRHYPALNRRFDTLVMLRAPDFTVVKNWRLEQERKLVRQQGKQASQLCGSNACPTEQSNSNSQPAMDQRGIARFIQFFQRITEQLLATLPERADHILSMDEQRKFVTHTINKHADN